MKGEEENVSPVHSALSLEELSALVASMDHKRSPEKNHVDSPQVVLKICPKNFHKRLHRRKTVLGQHKTNVVSNLKTQVQKKDLEIRRRSQENEELKEKIRLMAMKHKEENKIVENNIGKKEDSSPSVAKQMEDIMNKDLMKITPRIKEKKGFSFMGLACCTDR